MMMAKEAPPLILWFGVLVPERNNGGFKRRFGILLWFLGLRGFGLGAGSGGLALLSLLMMLGVGLALLVLWSCWLLS